MTGDRVHVGEVLALQRRAVNVEPETEYGEIGIRSFGRGIFHKEPVPGIALGAKRVFRIEPGDLVISNVFAWEGAIAVASETEAGKIGSHRFMTFVPVGKAIDSTWAAWFFQSEAGLELLGQASPGSAGRNRTLAIDRFEALEIPLPPIPDQRRVAASLDSLSCRATAIEEQLGTFGADDFRSMLPAVVDSVVYSHRVSRVPVGELAAFVSDIVHPGEEPGPANCFVGLQHVESHTGRCLGSDPLGPMKGRKFRFRPGDIVYGYLRPYLNKVWLADRDGLCSVDQYVLRARPGVDVGLLAHALRGRKVLDRAVELTHSLQLPRLRSGLLAAIEVPTVRDGDVDEVAAKLDRVRSTILALAQHREHQLLSARALLTAALNQAFPGLP